MTPEEELEMLRAKKARRAELEAQASGVEPGQWREDKSGQVPPPDLNSPAPTGPEQSFSGNMKQFGSDVVQGAYGKGAQMALALGNMMPEPVQRFGAGADKFFGKETLTKENAPKIPDTPGGHTGATAAELGVTLPAGGVVAEGANALRGALAARGFMGAGAAGVGTDIAGNAGVSAALEPENRGNAAGWGAAGAAAGNALSRTLGGLFRKSVSPEAKTLIDAGVNITPGQALSGPDAGLIARTLRATEDKATSIPFVGDVIKNAQTKSVTSFNVHKINEAIATTGKKVKHSGIRGLDEAEGHVSDLYDAHLPNISVKPVNAQQEMQAGVQNAVSQPLFDAEHGKKLSQYIERRIDPLIQGTNTPIDGKTFKELDSELGDLIREYGKAGIGQRPMANAFKEVRAARRRAAEGTTPAARQAIKDADEAYAKLVPIMKAGERGLTGDFTPKQLSNALRAGKLTEDEVTKAARYVLPNTIADSGTAGRTALMAALTPSGAGAGAAVGASALPFAKFTVPAALGAAALYTRPGLKAVTQGIHPAVTALRKKMGKQEIDPDLLEEYINNVIGRGTTAAGTE